MSIPTTNVEMCNLAFDLLRHNERCTSISTPINDSEALASRWYDLTRRSVLRAFVWNFARKRVILTPSTTDPEFGYENAYNLPLDYLAPCFIGENPTDTYEEDFLIEKGKIYMDNDDGDLYLCYIADVTDVARFDALFMDLFTVELALRFANSITGINKSVKPLQEWKKDLELKARMQNARENPPRIRQTSFLIDARRNAIRSTTTDGRHLFT